MKAIDHSPFYILLLLIFLLSLAISTKANASTQLEAKINVCESCMEINIERNRHYQSEVWPYASWQTNEKVNNYQKIIKAYYYCNIDFISEFWPKQPSCQGYFKESLIDSTDEILDDNFRRINERFDLLKKGNPTDSELLDISRRTEIIIERSTHIERISNFFAAQKSVENTHHYALFDDAISGEPVISYEDRVYRLENFKSITAKAIKDEETSAQAFLQEQRYKAISIAIGAILFRTIVYSLVRRILKNRKAAIESTKSAAKATTTKLSKIIGSAADSIQEILDKQTFRKAMIDEAAREITRKNLEPEDETAKKIVIQNAIIKALESGDEELANALKASLKML